MAARRLCTGNALGRTIGAPSRPGVESDRGVFFFLEVVFANAPAKYCQTEPAEHPSEGR